MILLALEVSDIAVAGTNSKKTHELAARKAAYTWSASFEVHYCVIWHLPKRVTGLTHLDPSLVAGGVWHSIVTACRS